jgi:predicted TIM-barrel fold metal-dependent hydrolase
MQMIFDVHTQIWSNLEQLGREAAERLRKRQYDALFNFDASPAGHEKAMACVDASLVFGFRCDRERAHVPTEYVAEFVGKDPHRRLGVAGIDPMGAEPQAQLQSAVDLGCVAVTVSPACQGFHPTNSTAMPLYERCAELSMPVFVGCQEPLTRTAMLEFARPTLWDEVARALPDLRIVFHQIGHPWIDETLMLLGKHANTYADIAGVVSRPWQLYNALLSAQALSVMDKLLFASGFPFETPAKAIEKLYTVNGYSHGTQLPSIPRPLIRGIVERNALDALAIEADVFPTAAERADETVERDVHVEIETTGLGPEESTLASDL